MKKRIRTGYTTGACAAAAAKAAAILLLKGKGSLGKEIEIPLPDGSRVSFGIHKSSLKNHDSKSISMASVIKDAGDDPDITNGAEICATLSYCNGAQGLIIRGGSGVGIVTKPGLAVAVGESAINPIPKRMIRDAVLEVLLNRDIKGESTDWEIPQRGIEITISVVDGEILAKKTLNPRLGIIGGISILGTTGIVKPISSEAWTATITSSMNVAKAMGHDEIVISAGRASEKAHMRKFMFPEECYVMMGDYLEYSLLEAKKLGFRKIHLAAQWAKMIKIAMSTPQTHVRYGALDIKKAVDFLRNLGFELPDIGFNTAREIFDFISHSYSVPSLIFLKVCDTAKRYAQRIAGIPVIVNLISYDGDVVLST